jgi:hypothetical protein
VYKKRRFRIAANHRPASRDSAIYIRLFDIGSERLAPGVEVAHQQGKQLINVSYRVQVTHVAKVESLQQRERREWEGRRRKRREEKGRERQRGREGQPEDKQLVRRLDWGVAPLKQPRSLTASVPLKQLRPRLFLSLFLFGDAKSAARKASAPLHLTVRPTAQQGVCLAPRPDDERTGKRCKGAGDEQRRFSSSRSAIRERLYDSSHERQVKDESWTVLSHAQAGRARKVRFKLG